LLPPKTEQKFRISRKLTNPHRDVIIEQMLLEPQFREARRRQGFVISHHRETADVIGSYASPMNLVGVCIEAEAFPETRFM